MFSVRGAHVLAGALALTAMAACSSKPEVPPGTASANQPLAESPNFPGTLVWKKPGLNPASYTGFIIPPADVYQGADAKFGSDTNTRQLASYMDREFRQTLGQRFRIAKSPGRGIARLQLTLVGTSNNVPVAATASRISPVGIVSNVVMASAGGTPTFTGTVTIEGRFFDSRTGEALATFVTTRAPGAMDLGATLTNLDAHEAAIAATAKDVREALEKNQTAALPRG
jgi:hypothetical protein